MPINIDAFEDDEDGPDSRSTAELIVQHLWQNRDKAFTRKEIAEGIDRNPNTVGTNLTRLKNRDLVRHRGNYWAITDDTERLKDAFDLSTVMGRLDEEDGGLIEDEEDAAAWADAQPGEPHPSVRDRSDASMGPDGN